jgi:hypothetical protein
MTPEREAHAPILPEVARSTWMAEDRAQAQSDAGNVVLSDSPHDEAAARTRERKSENPLNPQAQRQRR